MSKWGQYLSGAYGTWILDTRNRELADKGYNDWWTVSLRSCPQRF